MPANTSKETSIKALKDQLTSLQDKIGELEGAEEPKVRELFSWVSPERVFVKRDKRWFGNVALLVFVLVIVTLFLKEFLLIGVILAVCFVLFVLATVPPQNISHRFTTQGLTVHEHSYLWEELSDFWFSERHNHTILNIATNLRFPGELNLIIDKEDQDRIRDVMVKYIPFREVAPESGLDKFGQWFSKKLSSI